MIQNRTQFSYPFITENAGLVKTNYQNESRMELVMSRYEEWAHKHQKDQHFRYQVTALQVKVSRILFPLAGFLIGAVSSFAFVHPNSKYIGKCFTIFTTVFGYRMYKSYANLYVNSRYFGNYEEYPVDIRRMIDNADARYAWRWLKDEYHNIDPNTLKY